MKVEWIRTRELTAIIILMLITKSADSTPVIIAQYSKNSFWMIPVISFLIYIPSHLLLLKVFSHYKNKNLIEIIYIVLGKYLGFIIGISIFVVSFMLTTLNSRSYIDEINTIYFPESPIIILYFVLIGICFLGARNGLQIITSTSWLLLPYIMGSLVLLALLTFKVIIPQRIFPIFGEGLDTLVMQGIFKSSMYYDLFLITMAYPLVKDPSSFKKASYLGSIISVFQITLFYFLYCTFFDYKSIDSLAYPFHEIANFASIGQFFTNTETFFFSFWVLKVILRFMAMVYLISWIFSEVFHIKNVKAILLPISFLVISLGILPESSIQTIFFLKNTLLNYLTIPLLLFPLLLWVVGKWKGDYTSNV